MESILEFMYMGEATFYQERMDEFLIVAKNWEIKEISSSVATDDLDEVDDKVPFLFKKEEGRRSPASQAELFAHIWYFSFLINKTKSL